MIGIENQEKPLQVISNKVQLVTHTLGKSATWADWRKYLEPLGHMRRTLFADEDIAQIIAEGLLLSFQLLEASFDLELHLQQWGLHSAALAAQTSDESLAWHQDWPFGLQPQKLSRSGVTQILGEALVSTKAFSIFEHEVNDRDGTRSIGVKCDWQGQQLANLTMLRLGEFEPLPAFEFIPKPDRPAGDGQSTLAQPPVPSPEIICRSGEPTPKTGMYEGLLPDSHPLAASYNKSNMRFHFSQEGIPMIRMGMPDREQERLVVWIWRAPSLQAMRSIWIQGKK